MPGPRRLYAVLLGVALATGSGVVTGLPAVAATETVTLVGDLQSELGCSEDWQPPCDSSKLVRVGTSDTYRGTFTVPAGTWAYKVAINDSWDVNYGADGELNGGNLSLTLLRPLKLEFTYDDTQPPGDLRPRGPGRRDDGGRRGIRQGLAARAVDPRAVLLRHGRPLRQRVDGQRQRGA